MKTLLLIDGHALAYREYFALERTAMSTSDNQPTWAVYGFFKAIFDLLKNKNFKPDSIAVTFDLSRRSFRTEKFEDYKAQRASMPDNMKSQMGLIQEGLKAFDIPIYTKEGFEADDVIGTICKKATELGHKTFILTGDKDSFQLIDKEGTVKVLIPNKGELLEYNWNKVYEKMGVYPNQIIDYKALRGDVSDNIPGIKGIGDKTAQKLLSQYKTLENIYKNIDDIPKSSIKTKITEGYEIAKLSQYLATIVRDVNIDFDIEKACISLPDVKEVTKFLQKMQFHNFIKNIDNILSSFNANCEHTAFITDDSSTKGQLGLFSQVIENEINQENHNYLKENINDTLTLYNILKNQKSVSLNITTLENDNSIISDISFGILNKNTVQVYNITADTKLKENLDILKPIFEDINIKKYVHNAKIEYSILKKYGITLTGIDFDTILASYIKDPARQHDLKVQALEHLNFVMNEDPFDKTYSIQRLYEYWKNKLDEKELKILYDIELPLSFILSDMELYGVSIDKDYLKTLTEEFNNNLNILQEKIFKLSNVTFNINSPKQVAEVLYNSFGIKEVKKGKRYSTNAEILEELSDRYPVCQYLLEYRKYSKLISTYTEAIPNLISKEDGKIHTSFNQTVTTTGRLSSSNPNLQNIPTRTEEGGKIRKAFIPTNKESQVLLSADYSQIELRLLAHCSDDKALINAFNSNEDIHTQTAAKVFDVPISEVTKDMRRKAKAVNFGIIYGQSKYGLSKALNIPPFVAEEFIQKYFLTYPNVQEYMQKTIEFAHKNGYVETIFGRKRYLTANLNSSNFHIREAAERAAINQPLQGSAADLIKIAMNTLFRRLTELKLKSKIILQVHDELIIQTELNELDVVKTIVKESMELNQPLKVPLIIDIAYGKNWVEL